MNRNGFYLLCIITISTPAPIAHAMWQRHEQALPRQLAWQLGRLSRRWFDSGVDGAPTSSPCLPPSLGVTREDAEASHSGTAHELQYDTIC